MDREILATVTFQENCEYESSTKTRKIAVPKQTVEVDIDVTNKTDTTRNDKPQYNDELKFIASVYQTYTGDDGQPKKTPITIGRIRFFYLADGTKTPVQLNPDENDETKRNCLLNSQGCTSIIYRPNRNGQIYAVYVDDNDFYETATSPYKTITMYPIEVSITIDAPPILTDIHDEIELTAHVTKRGTNIPVQYGVVTFLHYQTDNNVNAGTNERVIGNPVMVEEDGTATIKYIPVQTDDDNEPYTISPPYKEKIRVVYNYSNVLYGEQWKYYKEASAWTQIAVCASDSLTIGLDNTNIDSEHGQHQYLENQDINLYGIITDKNNQTFPIKTSGEYKANLTFHIKGVHLHPKKIPTDFFEFQKVMLDNNKISEVEDNNFYYVEYSKNVLASYTAFQNKYYFNAVIKNLLPGFYTITASCKEQEGTNNKMYDAIDNSNILYVQVNYKNILPKITLSASKNTINLNENIPNIKGEITTDLSDNEKSILNGQRCKFYVPKINKEYTGTLTYTNEKLIGVLNGNISFKQVGLYNVYMSIPIGIYTNNIENSTYHGQNVDLYIGNNNSNPLLIQVENKPKITLDISQPSPSLVHYSIKGENINKLTNINVYLIPIGTSNISMINNINLTPEIYDIEDDIINLDPGDYKIQVESQDNDIVITKNFTIPIKALHSIIDNNNKKILGVPQNTISAFLYSKESLQSIDTNKIKAYIQSADTDFNIQNAKQATIQSTTLMKDGSLNVIVKTGLYKAGTWWLVLTYEGGGGFNSVMCKEQKFETFLYTPNVTLIPRQNNYYDIKIRYDNDDNFIDNNALVMHCLFLKDNAEKASGIIITNKQGYCSLNDIKNNNLDWWNDWNRLILSFSPYYEKDINILKNPPAYNALKNEYGYVFDACNITTANPTYNIKTQIIGNEEKTLYIGYEPSQITIIRPLS